MLMRFLYRGAWDRLAFLRTTCDFGERHPADLYGPRDVTLFSVDRQEHAMMDVIVLGLSLIFFVATIAYAYLCERL
jgi:hypothetical protein